MLYNIDPVRQYLNEIGRYPLLTAEEEIELGKRIKNGDKEATQKMINCNLRLVFSEAKKHKPYNLKMDFLDYVLYGNFGLIKAVDRWDINKGYKFSTYATWWIRQALDRAVKDNDNFVRVPVNQLEKLSKLSRFTREYESENFEKPTDETIMKELGFSANQLKHLRDVLSIINTDSIDRTIDSGGKRDDDSSLGDFVAVSDDPTPEDIAMSSITHDELEKLMQKCLTAREEKVVRLRYGFDDKRQRTLEEVGNEFGVTRERIRQIEAKAFRKIRNSYRLKTLRIADRIAKKTQGKVVMSNYDPNTDIVRLKCNKCNHMWSALANEALNKCECATCKNLRRTEEVMRQKKQIYELIGVSKTLESKFIDLLTPEEKKLIEIRKVQTLSKSQNDMFQSIIDKLKTAVKRYDETGNITLRRIKSIYDLAGADKRLIDNIIETLPIEDRKLIKKRETHELNSEDDKKFTIILTKIRKRIKNYEETGNYLKETKKKPIHERVGAPKELVDKLIETLTEPEKALLRKRETSMLNEREDIQLTGIITKLQRKVKQYEKTGDVNASKYRMSIYNRVGGEKEVIDKLINELEDKEKELIKIRETRSLTQEEQNRFTCIVLKLQRGVRKYHEDGKIITKQEKEDLKVKKGFEKMDDILSKKKKTIYELVNVDKKTGDKLIDTLNEEEKNLIEKRKTSTLTPEEQKKVFAIVGKLKYRYEHNIGTKEQITSVKETDKSKELVKTSSNERKLKSISERVGADKELVDKFIEDLPDADKALLEKREREPLNQVEHSRVTAIVLNLRCKINTYLKSQANANKMAKLQETTSEKEAVEIVPERDVIIATPSKDITKPSLGIVPNAVEVRKEQVVEETSEKQMVVEIDAKEFVEEKEKTIKEVVDETIENKDIFAKNYMELLLRASRDSEVLKDIELKTLIITCVRFGIGEGVKPKSIESIAKFYDMTPEKVKEISDDGLLTLHMHLLESAGSYKPNKNKVYEKENNQE